mmetsp:Transcript_17013/g.14943  ORF Transcript_17013/g.14943 Transcript_17013/m.14943 type:complete len:572 (+) Transcript_17013:23-1738(+)
MSELSIGYMKSPLLSASNRSSFKESAQEIAEDVLGQNLIISLDNAIKEEERIKKTPKAAKYLKIYKRILPLKYITLGVYFLFIFFELPTWCMDRNDIINLTTCDNHIYPNSGLPYMPQYASCILEMLCLLVLLSFAWLRRTFRKESYGSNIREILHLILSVISFIDIIVALTRSKGLFIAKFVRLIRISLSIRSLREAVWRILLVIYDAKEIFMLIILYVIFFSWGGFMLFRGTPQGFAFFGSLSETIWNMSVLLTTANFPDVMLPAYQMNTAYTLYFIVYILIGVYFLLNVLLAVFYSNYQSRVENSITKYEDKRVSYLEKKFFEHDEGNKGYLTNAECKILILYLLSIDSSHNEDNIDVSKFIKLLDCDGNGKIYLPEFYRYFDVMEILQFEKDRRPKESVRMHSSQAKLRKIMKNPTYDMIVYIVLILNLGTLFIRDWYDTYGGTADQIKTWMSFQFVLNAVFTLELIANFIVDWSPSQTFKKLSVKAEVIYTLVTICLFVKFIVMNSYGLENRLLELIVLLRSLRLFNMLKEVQQWKQILLTLTALLGPFYTLLIVNLILFYFFSII